MNNKYLLDTNICIHLFRNKYHVQEKLLEVGLQNCFVSEITVAELLFGAEHSQNVEKHKKEVETLLQRLKVLSISDVIGNFAKFKHLLCLKGNKVDDFDIMIGATAATYGLTMVTENVKHFSNIPNLPIENWIQR